jgi:hypothetical protein
MSTKERLHQLVDEMNDDQAAVLLIELEDEPPPLSEAERAEIDLARGQLRAGEGIPHDELMRRLRAAG